MSGYAPGQTVNVAVNVRNDSKQTLSDMDVQLNKVKEAQCFAKYLNPKLKSIRCYAIL